LVAFCWIRALTWCRENYVQVRLPHELG
jgi:hypothetical protein